ncbi:MAG TPA: GTPase HflX [Burkholderiaceae bacterium]|nr:GTPase HflX [Burkholderiaceae bacterium]
MVVGVTLHGRRDSSSVDSLDELAQLTESAGADVAGRLLVRRDRPDPALYLGRGKVEELAQQARDHEADTVVFDAPLSPAQQRNLERELGIGVLDRTALILEIFGQRAKSREGKLQVELARLEHLSTRLVRGWSHLERQRGGLGKTGGPGEKQIELDRRMIATRVKQLRERLRVLDRQRRTQRRARARRDTFTVSLVGYTNAGKSTLFNAMTRASSHAADQLFATLDTTTRRCHLGVDDGAGNVVVSDTVGFIRGLPHQLVAAFKSTLEESVQADLLLHVVDAASPVRDEQIDAVDGVLEEIGAADVPRLLVFNKVDLAERTPAIERDPCGTIRAVFVSALSGAGLDLLRQAIAERAQAARQLSATAAPALHTRFGAAA